MRWISMYNIRESMFTQKYNFWTQSKSTHFLLFKVICVDRLKKQITYKQIDKEIVLVSVLLSWSIWLSRSLMTIGDTGTAASWSISSLFFFNTNYQFYFVISSYFFFTLEWVTCKFLRMDFCSLVIISFLFWFSLAVIWLGIIVILLKNKDSD